MIYILIAIGLLVFSILAVRMMKSQHLKPRKNKFSQKNGPRKSQRF